MSLINRMLRDLSSRERRPGDVLTGIEVPPRAGGRGAPWRRGLLLLGLVAVFTAVLWSVIPRRAATPAPGPATTAPQAPPAATMTTAPAGRGGPGGLRLDMHLATVPAAPAPRRRSSGAAAPPAASPPAVAAAAPSAVPPAPVAPAPVRDARAAAARYAEARKALERGDDVSAADGFAAALALDPAHRAAREDLGTLRIHQGRLQEADALVRAGLEQEPAWPGYRRLAARLELARNNAAAAAALLEREPPPVAADPEYHGLLASAYQRLGRHEEAARAYQSLAQLQPGVAQWWAGYGLSRDALGDAPAALSAYAQARQLGGLDPRVLEHINRRSAALAAGP